MSLIEPASVELGVHASLGRRAQSTRESNHLKRVHVASRSMCAEIHTQLLG